MSIRYEKFIDPLRKHEPNKGTNMKWPLSLYSKPDVYTNYCARARQVTHGFILLTTHKNQPTAGRPFPGMKAMLTTRLPNASVSPILTLPLPSA